ncbi:MAG: hypothetical protein V4463_10300 [Pseudomonadota bacterium]
MEYNFTERVRLPVTLYLELDLHLMETRPGVNPDAFITELVKRWLAIEQERLALSKNGRSMRGFQWKSVFLPDGTSLRSTHHGSTAYAKVVGERIMTDDRISMTPSMFANRQAIGRNAWRFIWIRFPGEEHWVRAADCRQRIEEQARLRSKRDIELSKRDYGEMEEGILRS